MKKIFSVILAGSLLASSLTIPAFAGTFQSGADINMQVEENFDDGYADGLGTYTYYKNDFGEVTVADNPIKDSINSTDKALKYTYTYDSSWASGSYKHTVINVPVTDTESENTERLTVIAFKILSKSDNAYGLYSTALGSAWAGDRLTDPKTNTAGLLANAAYTFTANTWHDVKYVLDYQTHTYDIYINGTSVASGIAFTNNLDYLSMLQFGMSAFIRDNRWNSTTVQDVYYDEIQVYRMDRPVEPDEKILVDLTYENSEAIGCTVNGAETETVKRAANPNKNGNASDYALEITQGPYTTAKHTLETIFEISDQKRDNTAFDNEATKLITQYKMYYPEASASADTNNRLSSTKVWGWLTDSSSSKKRVSGDDSNYQFSINKGLQQLFGTRLCDNQWHEVTTVYDFKNHTYTILMDGKLVQENIAFSSAGADASAASSLRFGLYTDKLSSGVIYPAQEEKIYLDDIYVARVEAPVVTCDIEANAANVDPKGDFVLHFSNPVLDAETVKEAVTFTNTATGQAVSADLINVVLDDAKTTAAVSVKGGLDYLATPYKLTVSNSLKDSYYNTPVSEFEVSFTTKMAWSVYMSNVDWSISGSDVVTQVTVTNPDSAAKPAWLVVAAYSSENELLTVGQYTYESIGAGETAPAQTITLKGAAGAHHIRAFLWDSAENLNPYQWYIEMP